MEKITLFYFVVGGKLTRGRGENIKLFLVDANLEHDYVRLTNNEWALMKDTVIEKGYYAASLPLIKIKDQDFGDQILGRTLPILRFLSIQLKNAYHGSNEKENFVLDVVADMTDDWFESMKNSFIGDEEKKKHHAEIQRPNWLKKFESYYSVSKEGPYLLGEKIAYTDFLVYHLIDDDDARNLLDNYPNLKLFAEAFEERPKIKEYLASRK